jgi:NADH-quinone oxidoreductase subunit G
LQKLKEAVGYKLVNSDAKAYQDFLNTYAKVAGTSLYDGSLHSIQNSDVIITFGSAVASDNPMVRFAISTASKKKRAKITYMHPVEDTHIKDIINTYIKYEAGSEEGILAMLASGLLEGKEIPNELQDYFDALDIGYISAESNFGEEELEDIILGTKYKKSFSLIAGEDLYMHPRAKNIATLLGLIARYSDFSVTIIPPKTNSLGVALICDLDDTSGDKVIGYNASGDFRLSALGDGDLDMPSLNQQEGTFTNINKRVVPTNAALSYNGYTLNDIANELLGISVENTIDYTPYLPQQKGFKAINFDDMDHRFTNAGEEQRGYLLDIQTDNTEDVIPQEIEDISSFDGLVVYKCNPLDQFSQFTKECHNIKTTPMLIASEQFAKVAKVKDGLVRVTSKDLDLQIKVRVDRHLKGTIALLPTFMSNLREDALYGSYRYSISKIEQVEE